MEIPLGTTCFFKVCMWRFQANPLTFFPSCHYCHGSLSHLCPSVLNSPILTKAWISPCFTKKFSADVFERFVMWSVLSSLHILYSYRFFNDRMKCKNQYEYLKFHPILEFLIFSNQNHLTSLPSHYEFESAVFFHGKHLLDIAEDIALWSFLWWSQTS